MKKILLILLLLVLVLFGLYYLFPGQAFSLALKAERSVAGLKQHTIEVGDLSFSYLDGGQGEPLILIHGFGANKDNWTRFAKYLTPHYRVIAPDLNGFGESSQSPDNTYQIDTQAVRIDAFMQALKLDKAHIGGNSMGGYISGIFAAKYPEKVKSLLLIAPSGVEGAELSEIDQLMAQGKPTPMVTETPGDYDRLLEFVFVKPPYIPQPIKNMLVKEALSYQALHDNILTQLNQDKTTPALDALPEPLNVPTLIIWGEQDRALHVSGGQILADAIDGSKLEIMNDIGHVPMIEDPEGTAEQYLKFLGK